jgi:DNA ligase 1
MSIAAFANLLERLAFTPQRLGKERLLATAFADTPDPERGLMLAALTGDLKLRQVTPSLLRGLTEARVDPQLFAYSYDFVGDLAETIALIWPEGSRSYPPLSEVVHELSTTPKTRLPALIAERLDSLGLNAMHTSSLRPALCASVSRLALHVQALPIGLPFP